MLITLPKKNCKEVFTTVENNQFVPHNIIHQGSVLQSLKTPGQMK